MRTILRGMAGALLLAVIGFSASPPAALAQGKFEEASNSVLHVDCRNGPIARRVSVGLGKSLLVQYNCELKDVLVSDPEKVDAVVQASNRVFLIAKKLGQTNAFFFDSKGQQILTLELSVGADLKGLESVLKRFVAGSNIQAEMAGKAAVLTGSVRTPIDAKRAADIACQFVAANNSVGSPSATSSSSSTSGSGNVSVQTSTQTEGQYNAQTQNQAAACSGNSKLVINLLTVEGEDQVMLKVTVAEVQRAILKQLGINLGAVINSGNFTTALLTENALPLTAAAGLGTLPIPGLGTAGQDPTQPITCATSGQLCNWNNGPSGSTFGNSGVTNGFNGQTTRVATALRALERDGLVRTLAEPNLTAVSGEAASFLAGGEFPVPVVDSDGKLTVQFKKFGVGLAFTPVVLSEGRISLKIDTRGERAHQRGRGRPVEHQHSGAQDPSGKVDRRAALGRVAGHRRPAVGLHAPEHRRVPRPQGRAGARHPVPQPRLHQAGNRARRHRYPLHRASDRPPEPGAAGRRARPRFGFEGQLPRPPQPDLRQGPGAASGRLEG